MSTKRSNGAERMNALIEELAGQAMLENERTVKTGAEKAEESLQVQYLPLQLLRPDPLQARRVLPEKIHQMFHQQKCTAPQALKELVRLAQVYARNAGRPFHHPFEMLGNLGEEESEKTALSPEETLLHDLVQLAFTLQNDGQVNPLTVVDMSDGVQRQFVIETGERRFWATWLLRDYHVEYKHDGKIPCLVVPRDKTSPFRQAKENTSRAGLNAVAMARQVALLLLHVHGCEIPFAPSGMDFYRQALELDLRGKREHTTEVLAALGGMSKSELAHYKSLLKLGNEAIEIADRHNLEEGKLRYVINLTSESDQIELLQQIVEHNLTIKQIRDLVEKGVHVYTNSDDDEMFDRLPKSATQIAKLALKPTEDLDAGKVAQAFMGMERDKGVAVARLRALKQLLEDAEQLIYGS